MRLYPSILVSNLANSTRIYAKFQFPRTNLLRLYELLTGTRTGTKKERMKVLRLKAYMYACCTSCCDCLISLHMVSMLSSVIFYNRKQTLSFSQSS